MPNRKLMLACFLTPFIGMALVIWLNVPPAIEITPAIEAAMEAM